MNFRLGTIACLVASASFAIAGSAMAARARSRVAVVRTASNDPLLREASTRLRAELSDAGFDVVEIERAPGDSRAEVEADGGAESFATVAMNRAGSGALADIWISDHVSGKTVVRRLQVGAAPNAAAVLAIRALELLRASLLEVAEPAPDDTEAPRAKPPTDVLKWVKPRLLEPRKSVPEPFVGTALGVGATGLDGLRGVGLAVGPTLRVSHGLGERFFARLALSGPLVGPELAERAGTATVRQEFASVDFGWASRAKPLGVFGFFGLGAFDLHATGSAAGGYHSRSEGVLSFLSQVGVGGLARLGERLSFTAELTGMWLLPQPVVVIAGQDAGKAGAPSLSFSLGLLVTL